MAKDIKRDDAVRAFDILIRRGMDDKYCRKTLEYNHEECKAYQNGIKDSLNVIIKEGKIAFKHGL